MTEVSGALPFARSASLWAALAPAARGLVLVAVLCIVWISLHPFQSLGATASIELSSGNEATTYLALAALVAAAVALVGSGLRKAAWAMATRPLLGLAAWLAVTSVISDDPGTSLRRLVLTALVAVLAMAILPLATSGRRLALLLACAAGVTLALSYLGVLLAPDLAIHQPTDLGEPELAGDWRGVFAHKNAAAAVLSLFVFIGLYVARCGLVAAGATVTAASALFVLMSGGKSSLALLAATLVTTAAWRWAGGGRMRVVLVLAPAVLLNLAGLGSVLVPGIGGLVASLPVDATFTGRTDIWRFAIGELSGHLTFGHGFQAFWNTAGTRFGGEDQGWAGTAAYAHNSFLDMVVGCGLPGLALALLALVAAPLRDVATAERSGNDPALVTMLFRIWLFGLYLSGMETVFFDRNGPGWFTFLFAVAGLRCAATFRLRKDPAP